ncbi:MAG: DNRLRE domain-containing protein [Clostridia bacterium]|nr:DNRLRE domain-containing protein [Clostridia bacterium]
MSNRKISGIMSFVLVVSMLLGTFAALPVGAAESTECESHTFDYTTDFVAETSEDGISYKCQKCGKIIRSAKLGEGGIVVHNGSITLNAKSTDLIEGEDFYNKVLKPKDGGNIWMTFKVTPTDLSGFTNAEGGSTLLKFQIGNTHRIHLRGYKVDDNTVRFTSQNSAGKTVELSGEPILKTGVTYEFVIESDPETGKYYVYVDGQFLGGSGFKIDYGASEQYKLLFGGSGNFELTDFKIFNPTAVSESGDVSQDGMPKESEFTVKCRKCGEIVYTVPGLDVHSEAESKITTYENGSFKLAPGPDTTLRPIYYFPKAIAGQTELYQIEFTLTFTMAGSSSSAVSGAYNNGNGRNLLRYDGTNNSVLRQHPVEDGNGGWSTETVEIRSHGGTSVPLILMNVGESAKFTLCVNPAQNSVDIYVNGEYKTTREGDDPVPVAAECMRFGDSASPMRFTVSNMSIITPDKSRATEGKWNDGIVKEISPTITAYEHIYKCSCGETVFNKVFKTTDIQPIISAEGGYEMSKNGLDAILGIYKNDFRKIMASEDTYVSAGTKQNDNFSSDDILLLKSMPEGKEPDRYYRGILLKFNISELNGIDVTSATLELTCTAMEDTTIPTTVHVYSCNPADWDEETVTYNTRPEQEELEGTVIVTSKGKVKLNILDFLKICLKYGDSEIAFYLEGDPDSSKALNFATSTEENGPKLIVSDGKTAFSTELAYTGENPWEVAMEAYSTWTRRWEEIKARGDSDTYKMEFDQDEFSITVGSAATDRTDGHNTKYTDRATRNISTLKGYTASTEEKAKLDAYGGYMDELLKQEATGYFYTKKIDGRWWTIDPLGYPFFRTAANNVRIGSAAQTNRKADVLAKYGSATAWAEAITEKMKSLGFNSAGGWSAIEEHTKLDEPLSQTAIMYVLKTYAGETKVDVTTGGNTSLLNDVMPVFDPAFVPSAENRVKSVVSDYATNSYVYGWMSDNELPRPLQMLDNYLSLDISDSRFVYSYATAWTFMYMKTGKPDVSLADVTDELRKEFRAMVYDKYFEVVCGALERYAPYQMYMGCRFFAGSLDDESIIRVAGYWCDVITYNYYNNWTPNANLLANQIKWAGKPVIITEWYVRGMDTWEADNRVNNLSGAGWNVRTQEDRGKFYQNFALGLIESKNCVGFDWFYMQDISPDDKQVSDNGGNKGIFDGYGNEYTDFTKYISELNNQKYNLIYFFEDRNG